MSDTKLRFSDLTPEQQEIVRERRNKARRKKRIIAIATLSAMAIAAVVVVVLIITGIVKLINGSKYREVSNTGSKSTQMTLVENITEVTPKATATPVPTEAPVEEEPDVYTGPSKGLIIVDAGHGGYDGGTSSEYENESVVNLKIAYLVNDLLQKKGYQVYMTRTTDDFVGLNERASLANSQSGALCMVSIHQNSIENHPDVCGIEAWTYDREGCREFAEILSRCVSEETGAKNRGVSFRTNLVVTSKVNIPSVIIECSYMTNPEEALLITTDEYLDKITNGIFNAVEEFVKTYY